MGWQDGQVSEEIVTLVMLLVYTPYRYITSLRGHVSAVYQVSWTSIVYVIMCAFEDVILNFKKAEVDPGLGKVGIWSSRRLIWKAQPPKVLQG